MFVLIFQVLWGCLFFCVKIYFYDVIELIVLMVKNFYGLYIIQIIFKGVSFEDVEGNIFIFYYENFVYDMIVFVWVYDEFFWLYFYDYLLVF